MSLVVSLYRKLPIEIEAVQLRPGENETGVMEWLDLCEQGYSWNPNHMTLTIETLEGDMRAHMGDYIIRGVEGEFYPCAPSIFDATYEEV